MTIILRFNDSISEACKEKLQTFSDKILAQGLTANRPPRIRFPGMNEISYIDLQKLLYDYGNQ